MTFEEFVLSFPQVLCYDEGEGAGDAGAGAGEGAGDAGAAGGDEGQGAGEGAQTKTFTQDQLNEILAADRRKHQEQTKKVAEQAKSMESRLQKLIADKNTSEAQRAGLEADLEDLRASQRSEAEQREHLAKKAKEEHENTVNNLKGEAQQWESLFKESTVQRTLTDAAVKHEAFSPNQLVALLKDKTEMRPVKDQEGQVIPGRFEARTAIEVKGEDGEVMTAWKDPTEAVELMKNNPDEYGNLFRNAVIAGIGGGTAASTGKNSAGVDPSKLSIAEKARRFKEDPESLGLSARKNY
jgi:hypothetical protein